MVFTHLIWTFNNQYPLVDKIQIMLSEDQQKAVDAAKQGLNVFITGGAGTGKSYVLRTIYKELMNPEDKQKKRNVAVTAMTGCAAQLLRDLNARTLHSWAGIGLDSGDPINLAKRLRSRSFPKYVSILKTDTLIIDEVSMMDPEYFITLEAVIRYIKSGGGNSKYAKKNSNEVFGGMQVIFVGDFFQLPPVNAGQFIFDTPTWRNTIRKSKQYCVLRKSFRQKNDIDFQSALNEIRRGKLNNEIIQKLQSRLVDKVQKDQDQVFIVKPTIILPLRKQVDKINDLNMDYLEKDSQISYKSETIIMTPQDGEGEQQSSESEFKGTSQNILQPSLIKKETDKADQSGRYLNNLKLRLGAQVMVTANVDFEKGLVNGARGVVIGFTPKTQYPKVRLLNGITETIEPFKFPTDNEQIFRKQIPLIPAWAITIHKTQGQTLDFIEVDVGQKVFEFGQTYVALSRAPRWESMVLRDFHPDAIKAHPRVIQFAQAIGDW